MSHENGLIDFRLPEPAGLLGCEENLEINIFIKAIIQRVGWGTPSPPLFKITDNKVIALCA